MSLRKDSVYIFECYCVSHLAGYEGVLASHEFHSILRKYDKVSSDERFELIEERLAEDMAEVNQDFLDNHYDGPDHEFLKSDFLREEWDFRLKTNKRLLIDILDMYKDLYNDEL